MAEDRNLDEGGKRDVSKIIIEGEIKMRRRRKISRKKGIKETRKEREIGNRPQPKIELTPPILSKIKTVTQKRGKNSQAKKSSLTEGENDIISTTGALRKEQHDQFFRFTDEAMNSSPSS